MNKVNGHNHDQPLHLNPRQRAEMLHKMGLSGGWLLMSVSEMFEMKKNMDGCAKENERLNKQTARIVAREIVNSAIADKALTSARAAFALFAEQGGNFAIRADCLREVANIDEALSVLPKPILTDSENETSADDAKG